MKKVDLYREALINIKDLDEYLLKESGLPGKRGNLELAAALAEVGNEALFKRYLGYTPDIAPVNTPYEFLSFCGVLGAGKLLAQGKKEYMGIIKKLASDSRWRMREGVAMALQYYGKLDMDSLLEEMEIWAKGNPLEKRAAAAALCEPALLKEKRHVIRTLEILDSITISIPERKDRKSEEFKALRKGLAYCWSVAAAASPDDGKAMIEKWFSSKDRDIAWIMKENLKKDRLYRMDPAWVEKWKKHYGI
jgi:hypothetical protein